MSGASISLVLVLYGQRAVTEMALASLEGVLGARLGEEIELVLVDNASPDDTGELLDAWEGRATVVRNPRNLNFSGGCNAGARAAGGEILVFLNNDMEFLPGAIEAVAASAAEPGVGAAGLRLLFPDGTIQHAGVVWTGASNPPGPAMPQHLFHHEAGDLPAACAVYELDAVTAACIAIRRELFLDLGGYDEAYRNGLEDVDLCLRIRSRGLRIVYRGDLCLVHHESQTRGVDNAASAHNDAVFQARWGAVCGPDDELAANVFGGRLTVRGGLPLVPHEYDHGVAVSVEGHLRSIAAEAAEARALLAACETAGVGAAARDRLPVYMVAELSEGEEACLQRAQGRLRSPTALRIEVPTGSLYGARRRHGDVLRLSAAPPDAGVLTGVSAVWAATDAVADAVLELGVDPDRVAVLAPAIAAPAPGSGGAGLLALLPGDDLEACAEALVGLAGVRDLRLLASVLTPALAALAASRCPGAELLAPVTSELRFAALAADADGLVCLDPGDAFDRRILLAAATGTAVATLSPGPAAAVLGPELVHVADAASLSDALGPLRERSGARAGRRAAVLAACDPARVGMQLGALAARACAPPFRLVETLTPALA